MRLRVILVILTDVNYFLQLLAERFPKRLGRNKEKVNPMLQDSPDVSESLSSLLSHAVRGQAIMNYYECTLTVHNQSLKSWAKITYVRSKFSG